MTAQWIWLGQTNEIQKDVYLDFEKKFDAKKGKIKLRVSCDSIFCAYVNGKLASFSACADYPQYKCIDEYDITSLCKINNTIAFTVWYLGEDSQTYVTADAGLWFEIYQDDKVIAVSDRDTLVRKNLNFKNGYCKNITYQLGYSYYYDNTALNEEKWSNSQVIEKHCTLVERPQKTLVLGDRIPTITELKEDHLLIDMQQETCGHLDLQFNSPCDQELLITFGEHLGEGKVSRIIGARDFSVEFKAKKGENVWLCPLRRIAGRYLEVYFKENIKINYIGIRPVDYPVEKVEKKFSSDIVQKIYDTSVRTLQLCMHEHYEDCPWREQALYNFDSRNQMLCGYLAFKTYEFQRSNLVLMSKGIRPDGMLPMCFPAGIDFPIPFFTLSYILQVSEYVEFTKDYTILQEVEDAIEKIIKAFDKRKDDNGLIANFPHPYWNFYEWTELGNEGRKPPDQYVKDYPLVLNCYYVYVIEKYNAILKDKKFDTAPLKKAIVDNLYVKDKNVYKNSYNDERVGQLGNALAMLIGIGNDQLLSKVATSTEMVKSSLSMSFFVYECLIKDEKYHEFVYQDIVSRYKKMLDAGATSFWETDGGWQEFGGAGSLCHGWSALPIYFFDKLKIN